MSENPNPEFKMDLSYLKEVSSGNDEFMIEMIDLFLNQTPGYFEQLDNLIGASDWSKVADIAHKIKPTLAFMGADSAKDSMAVIEHNARNQTLIETIRPAFDQLNSFSIELFKKLEEVKQEMERKA